MGIMWWRVLRYLGITDRPEPPGGSAQPPLAVRLVVLLVLAGLFVLVVLVAGWEASIVVGIAAALNLGLQRLLRRRRR